MTNRDRVLKLRQADPDMPAASMARELGITREGVRQILIALNLKTDVRRTPVKYRGRWYNVRKPKLVVIPKSTQAVPVGALPLPEVCPKCSGIHFYREIYFYGWELKCLTCGQIVASGHS